MPTAMLQRDARRNPTPADPTPVEKDWAVYIFMKPDAGLEAAAVADIEEMKRGASGDDFHLVVQFERETDIERLVITEGREVLAKSPTPRMGRVAESLSAFAAWAVKEHPGKNRMLIVWGHSYGVGIDVSGPAGVNGPGGLRPSDALLRRAPAPSALHDALSIHDLASVSRAVQAQSARPGRAPFDVIGFDSCYMSSLEFAIELCPQTHYLVAAQGYVKRAGWDYRLIAESLAARPALEPDALAARIVDHLDVLEGNTALSRLDVSQSNAMLNAFTDLVLALERVIDDPIEARALRVMLRQAAYLQVRQFLDVRDVCHKIRAGFDGEVSAAASAVLSVMKGAVHSRARGTALGRLNGASLYCPLFHAEPPLGQATPDVDAVVDPLEYRELEFVRRTGWLRLCELLARRTS